MSRVSASMLAFLLAGCTATPTSVLLRIEGEIVGPVELLLTVFEPDGVAVKDRVLGEATLPETTVLFPPQDTKTLRILARARREARVVGEGAIVVAPRRREQVDARVYITRDRLPDRDDDGVPDVLDNCPGQKNPDQGPCSPRDAAPDTHGDAAPVPDAPVPEDLEPDRPADLDDLTPVDLPPPDAGGYKPLSVSALQAAFTSAKVPCIDEQGNTAGPPIPLVDTPTLAFFPGSLTLAGAKTDGGPAPTVKWVGKNPSVVVVWDPNACAWEEKKPGDQDWKSAGLLIRGASLDAKGRALLEPWVTVKDINILNVGVNGVFEDERFQPDDSGLSSTPQLVHTVNEAKKLVLSTAKQ